MANARIVPAMEQPMHMRLLVGLVAFVLLGGLARAQTRAGPWQDCDLPTTHVTVDSDALLPAILPGQRLLATCFAHAIRGSNLGAGQVRLESLSPPLSRGDLVAFRRPDDIRQIAIRRVIALPGDRVQVRDYRLLINDALLPTARVGEIEIADKEGRQIPVVKLHETMNRRLLGYDILVPRDSTDGSGTSIPFRVPFRFIYVLPDNRASAANIRTPVFGIVPVVNLIALVMVPQAK